MVTPRTKIVYNHIFNVIAMPAAGPSAALPAPVPDGACFSCLPADCA